MNQSNGLVAYYPFNGNANDESGNGNNGIDSGATLTTDRFVNANNAYSFDGSSSYINVVNTSSLQITGDITVAAWVKSPSPQNNLAIVEKYYTTTNPDHGWLIETDISGKAIFEGRDGRGGGNTITSGPSPDFNDGKWHFVIGQRNGNDWRIYLDGLLANHNDPGGVTGSIESGEAMRIGAAYSSSGLQQVWNGAIDDIRIYNRALSDAEIQALYHENGWGNTIHVQIDQFSSPVGDTVMVPVNVSFPQGRTYSSVELSFGGFQQSGLSFLAIDTTSSMMNNKGWQIESNNTDTLLITASAGAQDISGSGVLFDLKFVVTGSPCTSVPITITKAIFNTGTDSVVTTNGGVNIKAIPVYGDVDGNAKIQAYDASLVLKAVVDSIALDCQATANAMVTCDTSISAFDATAILQYVVGIVTSLPQCGVVTASGTITMIGATVSQGVSVAVPVYLNDASNIYSFDGVLSYDPQRLTYSKVEWASDYADFIATVNPKSGEIRFAAASPNSHAYSGLFATIYFKNDDSLGETKISLKKLRWNNGPMMDNVASASIITGIDDQRTPMPTEYSLGQNYPNPFNPTTSINYSLAARSKVKLEVFSTLGQNVATIVNAQQEAGYYDVSWQPNTSSGLYFYRLEAIDVSNPAKSFVQVRKMVLLK